MSLGLQKYELQTAWNKFSDGGVSVMASTPQVRNNIIALLPEGTKVRARHSANGRPSQNNARTPIRGQTSAHRPAGNKMAGRSTPPTPTV